MDGRTGINLLHAHPQVVYCNCVKFHQNRSSREGWVALTRHVDRQTDGGQTDGWIGGILLHAHPPVVYYNCVKFYQNRSSRLGGVVLTIIWTDGWTRTDGRTDMEFFLHAHPQVVYCNCVKFYQNLSSRLGKKCLQRMWKDGQKDGQTSRQTGRFLYTPQTFFAGGIITKGNYTMILS